MSHCVTFTFPDGRVCIVGAPRAFVDALLLPEWRDVVAACAKIGLTEGVVRQYRDKMATLTREEAIRAIGELDAPGIAVANGFLPTDVANLSLEPDTGLLDQSRVDVNRRRRFRGCWRKVAGTTGVSMPLARLQRMNEVRAERNQKLKQNDDDYSRALKEKNLTRQTSLEQYAQKLRDLPATVQPAVEACTTPEQLDAWRPSWPVDIV